MDQSSIDVRLPAGFRIEMQVLSRLGSAASDAELGRALAAADVDALALLYDRYGSIAYSVALRVLGDPGLAEDMVQESFLKIWNNAANFDPSRGSLRSWLLTSVRNRAIDQLRGRAAHERQEVDLGGAESQSGRGPGTDPWHEVSLTMERDAVTEALRRLPVEQKQAVELAYYGGYTAREIAEISKVPVSTIKGRMRLALEKLHSYLEGKGLIDDC
jgi:RNA polymerase sigma factor (sigma-70 family)